MPRVIVFVGRCIYCVGCGWGYYLWFVGVIPMIYGVPVGQAVGVSYSCLGDVVMHLGLCTPYNLLLVHVEVSVLNLYDDDRHESDCDIDDGDDDDVSDLEGVAPTPKYHRVERLLDVGDRPSYLIQVNLHLCSWFGQHLCVSCRNQ